MDTMDLYPWIFDGANCLMQLCCIVDVRIKGRLALSIVSALIPYVRQANRKGPSPYALRNWRLIQDQSDR